MGQTAAINQNSQENLDTNVVEADLKSQVYEPVSDSCNTTGTVVPLALKYEQAKALETVERRVNGLDIYVQEKLEYAELSNLCEMFSAEQVDAIAMIIYNLEERGRATINGDGTGVGKGRQAAALIRYATKKRLIPVFITEKPNLFSDIYRDLIDIKSDDAIVIKKLLSEKKKQRKRISKKDVENAIIEDVNNGEFTLDYNIAEIQENLNSDATAFIGTFKKTDLYNDLINEYMDTYFSDQFEEVDQYVVNKDYQSQVDASNNRLVPFVVNGRTNKTIIQDKAGNIIYEPNTNHVNLVIKSGDFDSITNEDGDVIMATYSQFRSNKPTQKKDWLKAIAHKCLFILDESHNAAGTSNTGKYFDELIRASKGCVYFSATFAKRPDNMPIYSSRTSIGDAEMTSQELISAFARGGVALQEVVSAQLTKEGEYIRRERSYEGVTVEYRVMDESQETDYQMPQLNLAEIHSASFDRVTDILRDIINFQRSVVDMQVKSLDDEYAESQGGARIARSDIEGGISNSPAFSGIFQLISQLLMAVNAEATAILAIEDLKNGRKPIIALANTMESFLDGVTNPGGDAVQVGDVIDINFKHVLYRRLSAAMRYRVDRGAGEVATKYFTSEELGIEGHVQYKAIVDKIESFSADLIFSPIDLIRKRVKDAGFTFEEVTGRDRMIDIMEDGTGMVVGRNIRPTNVVFREFNSNIVDCLLINQSGATGVSGHAMIIPGKVDHVNYNKDGIALIPNSLEPRNEVKMRSMTIMQAELDISFEVQKRGRVNRTGQVFPPKYIYVTSAIPAQQRLLMMLQKKLKSLDANSTGNQKQSTKILDIPDFLNKIGDKIVVDYLKKNLNINEMIGDPLKLMSEGEVKVVENPESPNEEKIVAYPDAANKVAGRVAILSVKMQQEFYDTMANMYRQEVERLKQMDEYDLEVEFLNYHAKTVAQTIIKPGDLTKRPSYFTRAVVLEKIEIDNLRKPYKLADIKLIIQKNLTINTEAGETITQSVTGYGQSLIEEMAGYYQAKEKINISNIKLKYDRKIASAKEKGENSRKAVLDQRESMVDNATELFEVEEGAIDKSKVDKRKNRRKAITEEETLAEIQELELDREQDIKDEKSVIKSIISRNTRLFEYFVPGRMYKFPLANYTKTGEYQHSIFMGFRITKEMQHSNPWAASAIELEFAMDNSLKQLNVPSNRDEISQIYALNNQWFFENQSQLISDWNTSIKSSSANRLIRYILTGNLMKAFSASDQLTEYTGSGRLVSFNLLDNPKAIRTGYLLPSSFDMKGKPMESILIALPIYYMSEYFKTASRPDETLKYDSSSFLQVFISKNSLTLSFKGSKQDFKQYITDKTLLELFGSDFKVSGNTAVIATSGRDVSDIVDYLWKIYKITINVSQMMAEQLGVDTNVVYDDTEIIIDPVNEINKDFAAEEDSRKLTESEAKSLEEADATAAADEMVRLINAERRSNAEKKLEVFLKMLI